MSRVRRARALGVWCAAVLVLPKIAHADIFVTSSAEPTGYAEGESAEEESETIRVLEHRVAIFSEGRSQTILEALDLESESEQYVWLRVFPARPSIELANPDLFDTLNEATRVQAPHHEAIKRHLFGPSLLTLAVDKFAPRRPRENSDSDEPTGRAGAAETAEPVEKRPLALAEVALFEGQATTSTTPPYAMRLPGELDVWLSTNRVVLSEAHRRALGFRLNQGWFVAALRILDSDPTRNQPATIGPVRFDYDGTAPVYPVFVGLGRESESIASRFFLMGSEPLTSRALEVAYDARPWEPKRPDANSFLVSFHRVFEPDSPLHNAVVEAGLSAPNEAFHLLRGTTRGLRRDLQFQSSTSTALIPGPGSGTRNSTSDVVLVLLMGLAPLIFAPEAWLFFWISARAREARTNKGVGFAASLWPLFSLLVGGYWLVTQTDFGRLAAVLPILFGLSQLVFPFGERTARPVRVAFKRKR